MGFLEGLKVWITQNVGAAGESIGTTLERELRRDELARDLERRQELVTERDRLIAERDEAASRLREAEAVALAEFARCQAALERAKAAAFDAAQAVTSASMLYDGRLTRLEAMLRDGAGRVCFFLIRELWALTEELRGALRTWDESRVFGSRELNPPQPRSNARELEAARVVLRGAIETVKALQLEALDEGQLLERLGEIIGDLVPPLGEVDPLLADRLRACGRLFLTAEGIPTEAP